MNQPNGICIELTPTQYDYAYDLIMMAYELNIPEEKGWDVQTYDNLVVKSDAVAWSSAPQDFGSGGPNWPDVQTCPCAFCKTCRPVSATAVKGPGRRGVGGGVKPPPTKGSDTPTGRRI